jgi:NhaA family Na+:H+ antiporter
VLVVAGGIALVLALRTAGVRPKLLYVVPGIIVWGGTYAAGIHPTIAGVVLGLLTPVQAWLGPEGFVRTAPRYIEEFERTVGAAPQDAHAIANALSPLALARREAVSPAESLIESLHPWVAFVIMPLFALANAGVSLAGVSLAGSSGRVALAVVVGLVLGKPIGILLASALALWSGIASLPAGIYRIHLLVLGIVAGIGFTMALFIAQLAFAADAALLAAAKLGVLAASVLAGLLGMALGRTCPSSHSGSCRVAESADAAERSTEA